MKKTFKIVAIVSVVIALLLVIAGMYKFNYLSAKPGYDVDGNKVDGTNETDMHWSWDLDNDGINDCEQESSCDDSVDYSEPRNSAEGLDCSEENNIIFDKEENNWVDCYGICHTCTRENGFYEDGTMNKEIQASAQDSNSFITGADISYINAIESNGGEWSDENGNPVDLYDYFVERGADLMKKI